MKGEVKLRQQFKLCGIQLRLRSNSKCHVTHESSICGNVRRFSLNIVNCNAQPHWGFGEDLLLNLCLK